MKILQSVGNFTYDLLCGPLFVGESVRDSSGDRSAELASSRSSIHKVEWGEEGCIVRANYDERSYRWENYYPMEYHYHPTRKSYG